VGRGGVQRTGVRKDNLTSDLRKTKQDQRANECVVHLGNVCQSLSDWSGAPRCPGDDYTTCHSSVRAIREKNRQSEKTGSRYEVGATLPKNERDTRILCIDPG